MKHPLTKRQEREWFLDEWRTGVLPLHDEALRQADSANAYAQIVIRTGLILNGGALIAIPAYAGLFSIDAAMHASELHWLVSLLIAGLLSAWLASFCAFLAVDSQSDASRQEYNGAASRVHTLFSETEEELLSHQSNLAAGANEQAHDMRKFLRFRTVAIASSFTSYFLFCSGAAVGFSAMI